MADKNKESKTSKDFNANDIKIGKISFDFNGNIVQIKEVKKSNFITKSIEGMNDDVIKKIK